MEIKAGDYVRYPIGMFHLQVSKVYANSKGELYINESNTKRYLYRSIRGYKWDTSLSRQIGFAKATQEEINNFNSN